MRVLEARPERGVGASPIMPTNFCNGYVVQMEGDATLRK